MWKQVKLPNDAGVDKEQQEKKKKTENKANRWPVIMRMFCLCIDYKVRGHAIISAGLTSSNPRRCRLDFHTIYNQMITSDCVVLPMCVCVCVYAHPNFTMKIEIYCFRFGRRAFHTFSQSGHRVDFSLLPAFHYSTTLNQQQHKKITVQRYTPDPILICKKVLFHFECVTIMQTNRRIWMRIWKGNVHFDLCLTIYISIKTIIWQNPSNKCHLRNVIQFKKKTT